MRWTTGGAVGCDPMLGGHIPSVEALPCGSSVMVDEIRVWHHCQNTTQFSRCSLTASLLLERMAVAPPLMLIVSDHGGAHQQTMDRHAMSVMHTVTCCGTSDFVVSKSLSFKYL